jgi:hypothetical protein
MTGFINRILPFILAVLSYGWCDGPPLSYVDFFAGEGAISTGLRL